MKECTMWTARRQNFDNKLESFKRKEHQNVNIGQNGKKLNIFRKTNMFDIEKKLIKQSIKQ